ncbi:hypothetical protein [Sphingomonas sp. SUN039]|uniref:hypothetical protein n=1 Tax=Sphingomonas sp. SUN039 TaxID=2937787 RepID=UPI002164AA09|nr:hypothetical protein [Sphingomonas sp. SUN039]UVO53149.1 hypothetical protein M0209_03055 [Sphingomonas sp. SUN039]
MFRALTALALIASPVAAYAANEVAVVSEMFVEKTVVQAGKPKIVLVKQKSGPPGTKLVFTHSYRNGGKAPATNFAMTNPIPSGVEYTGSDDAIAVVSVDGGKSFGPLALAKFRAADGTVRAARPEDVTHVRWALKAPIPVGGSGKFSFKGTVK